MNRGGGRREVERADHLVLPPDTQFQRAFLEVRDQVEIHRFTQRDMRHLNLLAHKGDFAEDDWRRTWNLQSEWLTRRRERIEAVRKFFAEAGDPRTQAQIALAWIWTRNDRTISIPGFKNLAQVKENIQPMEFGLLSNEEMKKINEIFERAIVIS